MIPNNIPRHPSLNRFVLQLTDYLDKHKFSAIDYCIIQLHAESALNAYVDARRDGMEVHAALEIANQVLFENVGESEYEFLAGILQDEFNNVVDTDNDVAMDFWVETLQMEIPDLFDGCDRSELGISLADIDSYKDSITGKIATYFTRNGLQ